MGFSLGSNLQTNSWLCTQDFSLETKWDAGNRTRSACARQAHSICMYNLFSLSGQMLLNSLPFRLPKAAITRSIRYEDLYFAQSKGQNFSLHLPWPAGVSQQSCLPLDGFRASLLSFLSSNPTSLLGSLHSIPSFSSKTYCLRPHTLVFRFKKLLESDILQISYL